MPMSFEEFQEAVRNLSNDEGIDIDPEKTALLSQRLKEAVAFVTDDKL